MSGLDKTLWDMKFTVKQLEMESKKMEKKQKEADKKAIDAVARNDQVMWLRMGYLHSFPRRRGKSFAHFGFSFHASQSLPCSN